MFQYFGSQTCNNDGLYGLLERNVKAGLELTVGSLESLRVARELLPSEHRDVGVLSTRLPTARLLLRERISRTSSHDDLTETKESLEKYFHFTKNIPRDFSLLKNMYVELKNPATLCKD